jgi:UDP-N-acetylglucosamine 2-epimerase (non-hydrolysing)
MKAAPVMRALNDHRDVRQSLVHTGQHYDSNMSDVFFSQLDIPAPDVNLDVGSGSHARQTAEIMSRIEPVLLERKPDIVLVYGDANSTVAAALVCSELLIRIAHVEAGLRSFDRTDRLADLLFTPSADGDQNLQAGGMEVGKIHIVENVMIDSLSSGFSLLPWRLPKMAYLISMPS